MKRRNYTLSILGITAMMAFSGNCFAAETPESQTEIQEQQDGEKDAKAVFDLYKDTLREAFSYLEEAAELGSSKAPLTLAQAYNWGIGVTEDYEKALNMLLDLTESGSEKAPRYIAMMYENGRGVGVDYAKVAEYYQIAAECGDITSQYYAGKCYEYGIGVDVDYAKAMEWYQQGASCEDSLGVDAMRAIAGMYKQGKGVEQSQELADEWYAKADSAPEHVPPHALEEAQAAESGETEAVEQDPGDAMRGVAHLYEEGKGVEQNQELADEWYEKAANAPEHVPANAKNTK